MDLSASYTYISFRGFVFHLCPYMRYRNIFSSTAPTVNLFQPYVAATPAPNWLPCRQAFLFSLVNPSGLGPTKMSLINGREQFAVTSSGDCGPVFGEGHDLRLIGDPTYGRKAGYSNLGNTYQCPPGQQETFFTGTRQFTFTDFEVFGIYR